MPGSSSAGRSRCRGPRSGRCSAAWGDRRRGAGRRLCRLAVGSIPGTVPGARPRGGQSRPELRAARRPVGQIPAGRRLCRLAAPSGGSASVESTPGTGPARSPSHAPSVAPAGIGAQGHPEGRRQPAHPAHATPRGNPATWWPASAGTARCPAPGHRTWAPGHRTPRPARPGTAHGPTVPGARPDRARRPASGPTVPGAFPARPGAFPPPQPEARAGTNRQFVPA